MIPAHIEKLIWDGRATMQSYTAGISGHSILRVPVNQFIIITHIKVFHYLDNVEVNPFLASNLFSRGVNFLLQISSRKTRNHYVIRPSVRPFLQENVPGNWADMEPGERILNAFPAGESDFPAYAIHSDNVHIEFSQIRNVQQWNALQYAGTPLQAQAPVEPLGYERQSSTIEIQFDANTNYLPNSSELTPGTPVLNNYFDSLKDIVAAPTILQPPQTTETIGDFYFPIINIQYAAIAGNVPGSFKNNS